MASAVVESGLTVLAFAREATLGFLADIPEDKWCHQPVPGANHALWVVGHLAHTDNYFLTAIAGQASKIPADWDELFGMGSTPVGDASKYPNIAETRDYLCSLREGVLAWYGAMDEAQAATPTPDELKPFAPNFGQLAHSIAWHEGMHAGQITVVRKSLGIAPKFG
ncbi:MAG: DinB family protein [Phycisphaerales bacterium]|nr:DinB family protein [Phycisphaerales bacterium]